MRRSTLFFDATSAPVPAGATVRKRQRLTIGVLLLAGVAGALFAAFWLLDLFTQARGRGASPLDLLLDAETLQNALGSLAQVIVAVLGIAITVVSIVVQLAATRYTSRIADMFFRDRTNLAIMGFFVVACLNAVWVSLAVTSTYVPRATVAMSVALVTGSLLLLIPYFAYVFDFLDPEKVIVRIAQQGIDAAFGRRLKARERTDVPTRQALCMSSLEHLADIAVNAVAQKDKVIASHATAALREVVVHCLRAKRTLPPDWFSLGARLRNNPDFMSLTPDSLADIEAHRTWLEWKGLRHFRSVFAEALEHLPEMAHVVAIETRCVADEALAAGDRPVTTVAIRYFNTLLRTALNARDVRAAYNLLSQYRQFAERLVREGHDETAEEVARHFRYYGQIALGMDLGFVTETVAYDLSTLCERAFEARARCHDALLRTFLEVDKEAETTAQEQTLRGVRKAQVKLAAYYLARGTPEHARIIHADMKDERRERLTSIHNELRGIASKDFWEITDRGINFDYIDDERRGALAEFFGWFGAHT